MEALRAVDARLAARHLDNFGGDETKAALVLGMKITSLSDKPISVFEELIAGDQSQRKSLCEFVHQILHLSAKQSEMLAEVLAGRRTIAVESVDDGNKFV